MVLRTGFFLSLMALTARGQATQPDTVVVAIQQHLKRADQFRQALFVQESLQNYFTALRLAEESQQRQLLALTSLKIGSLYEQYYRYNESVPYLKKAYVIIQQTDSLEWQASVANSIAWNYIKTQQIDSALVYSLQSVQRYQQLNSPSVFDYCVALESLGEIHALKGHYKEADKALALCMQLARDSGNEIAVGFTHYGFAFLRMQQKRYADARVHILACVSVAEKYAAQQLLADVFYLCYQTHRELMMTDAAYRYLEKYTLLKDKIHSEDIEKKAAIINANYEIQKNEADLKILTQLNAIQQMEIARQSLIRNIALAGLVVFVLVAVLIYTRIRAQRRFEQQELQRKKEELEQARKVQLSLLPQKPLENGMAEVYGKMITATEVGGDYYDYFKLDDHRVLIAFGDATGHGMTAGLIVTIAKVALINNLGALKESNNLTAVLQAVNDSLLSSITAKGIGLALQLFILDSQRHVLVYTSCGMPYPMLTDEHHRLHPLEMRQPPLGFFRQLKVEQREVPLLPGQLLVVASDGILERFNRKKEEYGLSRFKHSVEAQLQKSACSPELLDSIFADTDVFSESTTHHDDMTALCARLKNN